jgi:hypothetical protein
MHNVHISENAPDFLASSTERDCGHVVLVTVKVTVKVTEQLD